MTALASNRATFLSSRSCGYIGEPVHLDTKDSERAKEVQVRTLCQSGSYSQDVGLLVHRNTNILTILCSSLRTIGSMRIYILLPSSQWLTWSAPAPSPPRCCQDCNSRAYDDSLTKRDPGQWRAQPLGVPMVITQNLPYLFAQDRTRK